MNHKGVCRTAPATPGLFTTDIGKATSIATDTSIIETVNIGTDTHIGTVTSIVTGKSIGTETSIFSTFVYRSQGCGGQERGQGVNHHHHHSHFDRSEMASGSAV